VKTTTHLRRDWTPLPFTSAADAVDRTWPQLITAVLGAVDGSDGFLLVGAVGRRHLYTVHLSTPVAPARSEHQWRLPLRLLLDVGEATIAAGYLHVALSAVGPCPQGTHAEVQGTINWYQSSLGRRRSLGNPRITIDEMLSTYLHGLLAGVDLAVAGQQ
jgi:hypothetical protein